MSFRINNVLLPLLYRLLAPLLGQEHQKPYIRHFAAEAFAFLIRKMRGKDLADIVRLMLQSLQQSPTEEYVEGLAMVFFEAVKVCYGGAYEFVLAIWQIFFFSPFIRAYADDCHFRWLVIIIASG